MKSVYLAVALKASPSDSPITSSCISCEYQNVLHSVYLAVVIKASSRDSHINSSCISCENQKCMKSVYLAVAPKASPTDSHINASCISCEKQKFMQSVYYSAVELKAYQRGSHINSSWFSLHIVARLATFISVFHRVSS
jgi:hypothetical protein